MDHSLEELECLHSCYELGVFREITFLVSVIRSAVVSSTVFGTPMPTVMQ